MKNIIITGAASGLGKAVAQKLKKENLILVDENGKGLELVTKSLKCKSFVCDVSNPSQVKELKEFVIKNFKKLDCLINCAGVWSKGELSELDNAHIAKLNELDYAKKVIDTNVFGIIAMISEFSPIMIKQNYGQIINVNSQSGVETEEFCPVYNASKHGSLAYRKAVQRDLAKHNVKITDVCPGLMQTNLFINAKDPLPQKVMEEQGLDPNTVADTIMYLINLPHEITIPSIEVRHIKNY